MIIGYKVWTPKFIRVRKRMEFYQHKVNTSSSSIRKVKKYHKLLFKQLMILRANGYYKFYQGTTSIPKWSDIQRYQRASRLAFRDEIYSEW